MQFNSKIHRPSQSPGECEAGQRNSCTGLSRGNGKGRAPRGVGSAGNPRDPNWYRFRNVWTVAATPEETYDALVRLTQYPSWWPEVKEVRQLDWSRFQIRCRSLLPYELRFVIEETTVDPDSGVLAASLTGDLEGYSAWKVTATPGGSRLTFDEEVITRKPLLKRLALLIRPAFKANHALMMRHGETGLRAFLEELRRRNRNEASPPPKLR